MNVHRSSYQTCNRCSATDGNYALNSIFEAAVLELSASLYLLPQTLQTDIIEWILSCKKAEGLLQELM